MSQRAKKSSKLPEAKPANMSMYIDRIIEARGRGASAQYYVRLAGDSPDFAWLKAQQIDRELILDFNRRKVREKRAEARRLRTVKGKASEPNRIDKYFKLSQDRLSVGERPQSRLSASQPVHLSEYLMEEDHNRRQVASLISEPIDLEADLAHATRLNAIEDELPTVDWLIKSSKLAPPSAPDSREQAEEVIEKQQTSPELNEQSPVKMGEPAAGEQDLVRCNVCHNMKVKCEQTLLSICGHLNMCYNCAAGIFVSMLRSDCLICNQMDSFALHMFEVIKHLTCQLMATSVRQAAFTDSTAGSREPAGETPSRSAEDQPPPSGVDN